nr:divalent-cation tolerance protein CutA [uncultured Cohaesibacter sp.]
MSQAKSDEVLLLYGTCPDVETARRIARSMLEESSVACVNILSGMVSLYQWQGQMEEANEVAFIAKSTRGAWEKAAKTFQSQHPYDEPALVALPACDGLPGFMDWVRHETIS